MSLIVCKPAWEELDNGLATNMREFSQMSSPWLKELAAGYRWARSSLWGLPPGCFGETGYFVVAVKTLPLKDKDAKE